MYDVAIAAVALPVEPLSATIDALTQTHPMVRILVGLADTDHDARSVIEHSYPEVEVVSATGVASIRSALVAAATADHVFFVESGFTVGGGGGGDVDSAVEVMRRTRIPLLFAAYSGVSSGNDVVSSGVFRCRSDEGGLVAYEPIASSDPTAGPDLDAAVDADIGGDSFVVDRAQIGPNASVDWDAQFVEGFANRDLFTAIARHPELQAKFLPSLVVDRISGGADDHDASPDAMLARYLRKWAIHTEHFGPSDVRRHVSQGRYSGTGVRVDARSLAGSIAASRWKHPRTMVRALAKSLTTSRFNHYVVSESADMLFNNMVIAPDGSWIHVGAAHCETETIRGWLSQMVTGLAPRQLVVAGSSIAGPAPDGLVRPRDIGLAATVSLLESPTTLKFTFVTNPYSRAVAAFAQSFGDPRGGAPAAEALRNQHLHGTTSGFNEATEYTLAAFLDGVAAQADHERDRQWRVLSRALAWGRVNYDVVGTTETFADDVATIAHRLDFEPPDVGPAPAYSGRIDGLSGIEAELVRRIYRDDFDNFGYAHELTAGRTRR